MGVTDNNHYRQRIYHVQYTSSHSNTEVKQHWAWIILGCETLKGISSSAGTYPPPLPPADRVQSFQTLFVSIKLKQKKPNHYSLPFLVLGETVQVDHPET
jgi:hypothetical protein